MKQGSTNIISWGGLGDALLLTPTLRALKEKYPQRKIRVFYLKRHRDIFLHNPHIDSLKEVSFRRSPVEWVLTSLGLMKFQSPDYSAFYPSINYTHSLVEVVAEIFGVELRDKRMEVFLTEAELSAGRKAVSGLPNPVAVNPYAVCTKNKEWDLRNWEALIAALPGYTFVQLGLKKEQLLKGAKDMRGTSIRESMAIVKNSRCYVGVDSFLAHAAAAVNTPAVVLFGPSPPITAGHPQNINIYKESRCSPCIDLIMNAPCPYGRECMNKISVQEVRSAILRLN